VAKRYGAAPVSPNGLVIGLFCGVPHRVFMIYVIGVDSNKGFFQSVF